MLQLVIQLKKKKNNLRLRGIFNATENFSICRLKITNATLSSFAVLISHLLAYIHLMASKLNRSQRSQCVWQKFLLGIASCPSPCNAGCFYLLSCGYRFFWAMFNWIKEFIQLEMSCRAHWGSFTVPIYIIQCCHHHPLSLSPLSLALGSSSPSPPAAEPFSTAHWACQSHLQGHTRLRADVKGEKQFVQLRPKKVELQQPSSHLYCCRSRAVP